MRKSGKKNRDLLNHRFVRHRRVPLSDRRKCFCALFLAANILLKSEYHGIPKFPRTLLGNM